MLNLTTPALLFPALSLLLLAYTNRFLALAALIRQLHARYTEDPTGVVKGQIQNLQRRIRLIQFMQIFGVGSLLLCVLTMALLFFSREIAGDIVFALSLLSMMISLAVSLVELSMSSTALSLQLSDMESGCSDEPGKQK
jgi:signal transduction histidine kinase